MFDFKVPAGNRGFRKEGYVDVNQGRNGIYKIITRYL
jgi:hypothetical protein